jgi:hypothetical protein
VIIFDASYLLIFLRDDMPPARDRNDKPVEKFKERIQFLIGSLDATNTIIGIPTPALAEIMVRAGSAGPEYLKQLRRANFVLLPFDTKAAIEAAHLIFAIKKKSGGQRLETWAKIKFDLQITAIAKSESATIIYSDDLQIETHGKRLGITVIRICDLPLPPEPTPQPDIEAVPLGAQQTLSLSATEEESPVATAEKEKSNERAAASAAKNNELEADPAHSPTVQGSDSGRAEGEAAGAEAEEKDKSESA